MSTWIKEIQERAETVLNKIDQNAAVALQPDQPKMETENPIDVESGLNIPEKPNFINFKLENELAAYKIALADVTSEKDHLKEKLSNMESQLENLTEAKAQVNELLIKLKQANDEKTILEANLEQLNTSQNKVIIELESSLKLKTQEYIDLNDRFAIQKMEISKKSDEYEKYKKKAQISLQEKDAIINSIKNPTGKAPSDNSTELNVLRIDLESLKIDFEKLEEDYKYLESKNKKLDVIIENQKINFKKNQAEWHNLERKLRENLALEQSKTLNSESELERIKHELIFVKEEFRKYKDSNLRANESSESVMNRNTISQSKGSSNSLSNDLRMKSLTETLVEKQNTVEALTAERNALRIQLENLQNQFQILEKIGTGRSNAQNSECINLNDTDDGEYV